MSTLIVGIFEFESPAECSHNEAHHEHVDKSKGYTALNGMQTALETNSCLRAKTLKGPALNLRQ